ncbi:hypothetical protein B0H14DRAFT_3873816 [Mycena olivaceomarginata]|nr:hypothetical protein B0H14DRAFT_3873816 [Mycena olivaceomarginata]
MRVTPRDVSKAGPTLLSTCCPATCCGGSFPSRSVTLLDGTSRTPHARSSTAKPRDGIPPVLPSAHPSFLPPVLLFDLTPNIAPVPELPRPRAARCLWG